MENQFRPVLHPGQPVHSSRVNFTKTDGSSGDDLERFKLVRTLTVTQNLWPIYRYDSDEFYSWILRFNCRFALVGPVHEHRMAR